MQNWGTESRPRREWLLERFREGRREAFSDFVGSPGGTCLSGGWGKGTFETEYIADSFDELYVLKPNLGDVDSMQEHGLAPIRATTPPVPFRDDSLDVVVANGIIEKLDDKRGFVEEVRRVLKPGAEFYVTAPVDVGVGGFFRHLARCYADPDNPSTPDGIRRYVDYSLDELLKDVPRNVNGRRHRYYNYTYLLSDLEELFEVEAIQGWPIGGTRIPNLIYFIAVRNSA